MKKEELIELIKYLHSEDKTGNIVGVFHDRYGGVITCLLYTSDAADE